MITQRFSQKAALSARMSLAFFGINLGLVGGIYIHTELRGESFDNGKGVW